MKQSTYVYKILLGVFLVLNISLLFSIKNKRKEYNILQLHSNQRINDSIQNFKQRSDNLLSYISSAMEFSEEKIDSDIVLLDENGNPLKLKNIVGRSPKLVFKYSDLSCETCVEEQMALLKKASEKIGPENIVILTNYDSPRKFSQFVRMNQVTFKVLNLQNSKLSSIDFVLPYYFILDNNFMLLQPFIPIRGEQYLTTKYFEKVSEKYFGRID